MTNDQTCAYFYRKLIETKQKEIFRPGEAIRKRVWSFIRIVLRSVQRSFYKVPLASSLAISCITAECLGWFWGFEEIPWSKWLQSKTKNLKLKSCKKRSGCCLLEVKNQMNHCIALDLKFRHYLYLRTQFGISERMVISPSTTFLTSE